MKKLRLFLFFSLTALFVFVVFLEVKFPKLDSIDFRKKTELRKEIKEKRDQIEILANLKLENDLLKKENEFLKEEKLTDQNLRKVDSEVIGFSYSQGKRYMVLAKGSVSNISTGCFVARNKNFIGIVEKVTNKTAFVNTINSPDFDTEGEIIDVNAKGVIKSKLDGLFMEEIVSNDQVRKDFAISTLKTEEMPLQFFVGTVERVFKEENSPVIKVEIKTYTDFENMDFVSVYCK